jgi:hypothetical protein
MPVTGYPPGTCPVCLTPMDLALRDAGEPAHPLCVHPERRRAEACDFAGCLLPAWKWPHGNYDLGHAKMMAPRRHWAELGIPLDKPEPEPRPRAAAASAAPTQLEAG